MRLYRTVFHALTATEGHLTEWRWCVSEDDRRSPRAYWRAIAADLNRCDAARRGIVVL